MNRRTRTRVHAVAVVAAPLASRAQADEDAPLLSKKGLAGWSVVGAEVDAAKPAVDVQAGWPSTNFGYTFGLSPTSDVSLRFGLLYGFEGTTAGQFGLSFYAPLRFELPKEDFFHWVFHVDPGIKLYTESTAAFGFQFPVGLVFGFPIQRGLEVGFGLDFNMTLLVTGHGSPSFIFGPLVGPYVEYHLNPYIALGLNTRFGAAIQAVSGSGNTPGGTHSDFAFTTQLFIGYRL